jgi:hypothetical protein
VRLRVIIPHHSRRALLGRALLAVQGWPALVVDDGPPGRAPLGEVGAPVLRTEGALGFARAANAGLAWAEAAGDSHALLLNDDAAPEPGCLDALVAAWTDGDGALAPTLVGEGGAVERGIVTRRWGRVRAARPGEVADAYSGACLLLPTSLRFDPAFRHGFEDIELCRRLRALGRPPRLVPGARCGHWGGATLHRQSGEAQRHAISGHLRLLGGGRFTPVVLGLGLGQICRDGPSLERLAGLFEGWRDWRRA